MDGKRARVERVDTAEIDRDHVGNGARLVVRVDPAMLAEIMLRDLRVPLLHGKRALALGEAELFLSHAMHDRVLAPAQRAIADETGGELALDFELHRI